MFHCQAYRVPVVGSPWLATPGAPASATSGASGSSSATVSSGWMLATPLSFASFAAAAALRSLTIASPAPVWLYVTVPPSAATFPAKSAGMSFPDSSTR